MSVICDVLKFASTFCGEKKVIGYSCFNNPILAFRVKKTEKPLVIAQYAIHAREYVTTYLALKQISEYEKNAEIGTVWFIPLLNPDGVQICQCGNENYKANGRGVDLNVNFDARWGTGKNNVKTKGDSNYIGSAPFSEPETQALRDFTLDVLPDFAISYHSKGREIYWQFFQQEEAIKRDEFLADVYAKKSNYAVKTTPDSAGGYKDWCIEKLKIPALTIEVGDDRLIHPIKKSFANALFKENEGALIETVRALEEERWKKNL